MTTIDDLQNEYTDLEFAIDIKTEEAIRTDIIRKAAILDAASKEKGKKKK